MSSYQGTGRFGLLPVELRVHVYQHLFGVSEGTSSIVEVGSAHIKHRLAVLRVCRASHLEAAEVFYGLTLFKFTHSTSLLPANTFLSPASTYAKYVKRLMFSAKIDHPRVFHIQHTAQALLSLGTAGAKYKELTLVLYGAMSLTGSIGAGFDDSTLSPGHPLTCAVAQLLIWQVGGCLRVGLDNAFLAPPVSRAWIRLGAQFFKYTGNIQEDISGNFSSVEKALSGSYVSSPPTMFELDGVEADTPETSLAALSGIGLNEEVTESEDSDETVDDLDSENGVSWNDMVGGYGDNGFGSFSNLVLFAPHTI